MWLVLSLTIACTGADTPDDGKQGSEIAGSGTPDPKEFTPCPEERGDMCTAQYDPVCGTLPGTGDAKPVEQTFSNACEACREPAVSGYRPGPCQPPENR